MRLVKHSPVTCGKRPDRERPRRENGLYSHDERYITNKASAPPWPHQYSFSNFQKADASKLIYIHDVQLSTRSANDKRTTDVAGRDIKLLPLPDSPAKVILPPLLRPDFTARTLLQTEGEAWLLELLYCGSFSRTFFLFVCLRVRKRFIQVALGVVLLLYCARAHNKGRRRKKCMVCCRLYSFCLNKSRYNFKYLLIS